MLDIKISQKNLVEGIRKAGSQSIESRQIAKRLTQLLPVRFEQLKRQFLRSYRKVAVCERHALTDKSYVEFLQELNNIRHQALQARVEYETRTMLFQARQTLRRLRLK